MVSADTCEHEWEFKMYRARCPKCGTTRTTDPLCHTCERAFPEREPEPHECPDMGLLPSAAPLQTPGMYPFRVVRSRR